MQHELTPLLYLGEKDDTPINDVAQKLSFKFSYHYLQNEDNVLSYIVKDTPFIFDKSFSLHISKTAYSGSPLITAFAPVDSKIVSGATVP